jgi:hypothetical protein
MADLLKLTNRSEGAVVIPLVRVAQLLVAPRNSGRAPIRGRVRDRPALVGERRDVLQARLLRQTSAHSQSSWSSDATAARRTAVSRWNDARTSIPCSRFPGFARASSCSNSASRSSYSALISRVESSPSAPDPSRSRLTKAAIGARNCVQIRRRYKGGSLPGAVSLETLN